MKDFKKGSKKESSSSPKGEGKAPPKKVDPNRPMRRKNRIFNDGKDWFDTHPDA